MNSLSALMLTLSALNGAPQGELLDFTSKSCAPCQAVAPTVERLRRKGYPIRKIDVDKHPEVAQKYGVRSIPQFILVINGKPRKRLIGPQSARTLVNLMAQIPKSAPETKSDAGQKDEEKAVARDDRPSWRQGIPIPFLGKSKEIEAEDIEEVRGQNDDAPFEKPLDTGSTSAAADRGPLTNDPMSASVRLRVNQNGTINHGTGTVIESRPSRTLVITCGHIFRGIDAQTPIDVDYFEGQDKTTWKGKVLRYDEQADVGLIAVRTDRVLPSIHIAEDPDTIRARDLVSSIGCGNGKPPTRWQMFVKSVNQFRGKNGSSIIECTHAPLSGRSGGGLFNRRGELIGICMAADRDRDSGLYAGLKEIHKLLEAVSLTSLYKQPEPEEALLTESDRSAKESADADEQKETPQVSEKSKSEPAAAPLPKITPAKVHRLSNDEIDAVAAALQTSGKRGVKITIESLEDSSEAYQILITNRAEPVSEEELAKSRPAESTDEQLAGQENASVDSFEWDNLLERRETNKLPASELSATEFPVWAR